MPGVIDEIIRMSVAQTDNITELLRKALIVSKRLELPEIEHWLSSELNGYEGEVPNYRIIKGKVMAHNPYRGPIPIILDENDIYDKIPEYYSRESITQLAEFAKGQLLKMSFASPIQELLQRGCGVNFEFYLNFTGTQFHNIVETVRNRVLELFLELEKNGIVGENMTFSSKEKEMTTKIHFQFGDITGSQIQIGSDGANQQITSENNNDLLKEIIPKLKEAIEQGVPDPKYVDELKAEIATIEAQSNSPKTKWEIVKPALNSIKEIFKKSASGAIGLAIIKSLEAISIS